MVCKRTKLQFFTHFYNQKQQILHTRTRFICERRFLYNEQGLPRCIINPPHKVDTNDKRKEKTAHISLFTEIIRIFAKVYY